MKYIHRSCLDQWRVNGFDPKTVTHCGTCKAKFRLEESEASVLGAEGEIWVQILRFLGLRLGTFFAIVLALGFVPPLVLGMDAVRMHSSALLNHVLLGTTSSLLFTGGYVIIQVFCSINLLGFHDLGRSWGGSSSSSGSGNGGSFWTGLIVLLAIIGAIYLLYHLAKGIYEITYTGGNLAVINLRLANKSMRQRIVQRYRVLNLESDSDTTASRAVNMHLLAPARVIHNQKIQTAPCDQ